MSGKSSGASETPLWRHPVVHVGIYVALSLLYFLPAFLPGRHVFGTDYLAAGYFKHEFTSRLIAEGTLPGWIPFIFGGVPVFANPASTFYPVKLVADLFLPVTRLYPAVYVVHFAAGGVGTYLLARELDVRGWAAFLAGLAFQFTGITMSSVYAGHDGRIIVATLLPLFFFFLYRGVRTASLASAAGAAATLGFSLLSFQIQSNYYLLLAGALWTVFALVREGYVRRTGPLARRVALGLGAVAFGFAMASVNFLPFQEYVGASPRGGEGGRGYEYSTSWSMPPEDLTALAVPEYVGVSVSDPESGEPLFPSYQGQNPFKLHSEYVGALVLVLLLLGAYYERDDGRWWFFAGLGLFALTIALGGHTPIYRVYYAVLPYTEKFRAPSIGYFVVAFALVVMGALTLERLAEERERRDEPAAEGPGSPTPVSVILGGTVGASLLLLLWASASGLEPGRLQGVLRFAAFASLTAGALWLWMGQRIGVRTAVVALALITVADLWIVDRRFFHTVPPPEEMFAADGVTNHLLEQPGEFRVWSLPLGGGRGYRQGNYLSHFGIHQAGGEHGNQIQRYNEFVGAGEQTYVDWHNFLRHPQFLNMANVHYLVAGAPVQLGGFPQVHSDRSGVVYENPRALPRAFLVPSVRTAEEPDGAIPIMQSDDFDPRQTAVLYRSPEAELPEGPLEGEAEIVDYASDRVVVRTRADRPALLVLADNHYQGWRARVDGEDATLYRADHTFRGVVVGAGDHEVTFRFHNRRLWLGFWISLACFSLLGAGGLYLGIERLRRGPSRRLA